MPKRSLRAKKIYEKIHTLTMAKIYQIKLINEDKKNKYLCDSRAIYDYAKKIAKKSSIKTQEIEELQRLESVFEEIAKKSADDHKSIEKLEEIILDTCSQILDYQVENFPEKIAKTFKQKIEELNYKESATVFVTPKLFNIIKKEFASTFFKIIEDPSLSDSLIYIETPEGRISLNPKLHLSNLRKGYVNHAKR